MNLEKYKRRKREQKEEIQAIGRRTCPVCLRPEVACLCQHITPIDPNFKLVILMHPKEFKKERVGTGKLTSAAIKESEIIVGLDFTENKKVNEIISDPEFYSVVLYPGENSINISKQELTERELGNRKLVLFLIDATWPCSRKMMKLSQNLQSLPRISFTPPFTSGYQFKRQPKETCLSTIEATYWFTHEWRRINGYPSSDHQILLDVFRKLVDFQTDFT